MTHLTLFLTAMLSMLLSACTTLNKSAVENVRRVAIVGFEGRIVDSGDQLQEFLTAWLDQSFGPKFYQMTQNQLKKSLEWQFVSRQQLTSTPIYQKNHESKGSKSIKLLNYKNKMIMIPGVLETISANSLVKKKRAALARELDVDAFLLISYEIRPEEVTKGLSGKILGKMIKDNPAQVHLLEASVRLTLISAKTGEEIWKEPGISARSSETPTLKLHGISFPLLKQRALAEAFSNALAAHISKLKS